MAPALAPTRSWRARAPETGPVPCTPTAVTEQTERQQELNEDESPTAVNYPSYSEHGCIEPSDRRGVGSSRGRNPRVVREAGPEDQPRERRCPTGETPMANNEVDGRPSSISPSTAGHNRPLRHSSNGENRNRTHDGGSDVGSGKKSDSSSKKGSSARSNGRSSFFFSSGYSASRQKTSHPDSHHPTKESGDVVEGTGSEEGQAMFGLLGEEGEASTEEMEAAVGSEQEREVKPRGRDGGDGEVDFPPDFDAGAKGSDSDDGGKRGGGSLGTKSGSTSLLSMLSGSPRSLSTNQDSAAGSSPRTPVSDHSSDGAQRRARSAGSSAPPAEVAAAAAAGASAPVDRSHKSCSNNPRVGQQEQDARSSSNMPTALSQAYDDGDELQSATHPTPLSSAGGKSNRFSEVVNSAGKDGKNGSAHMRSGSNVSNISKASTVRTTKVNTGSLPSTFMERLKYWGGVGGGKGKDGNSGAQASTPSSDQMSHPDDGAEVKSPGSMALSPEAANHMSSNHEQRERDSGKYDSASGPTASPDARHRLEVSGDSHPGMPPLETITSQVSTGDGSTTPNRTFSVLSSPSGTAVVEDVATPTSSEARGSTRRGSPAGAAVPWQHEEWREEKTEEGQDVVDEAAEEKAKEDADDAESGMDAGAAFNSGRGMEGFDEEKGEEKSELSDREPPEPRRIEDSVTSFHRSEVRRMDSINPRGAIDGPEVSASAAPSLLALVDAASVHSGLDSSTSGHDTSPSEDGGMMAEILTDRVMEVCTKMEEAVASTPADERIDMEETREQQTARRGSNASSCADGRDQGASRRASFQSAFFSTSTMAEYEEKRDDTDDDVSVLKDGAAARKLRRETMKKRSRSRRALSSALAVPTDPTGAPINAHTAAYNGEAEVLQAYIVQGGDLEARDQFQATALMLCAERNHVRMVDALLSANADVCAVDENGNSALHLACFYGHREVVRLLLSTEDVDVAVRDAEGRTPLHLATDPVIRRLIQGEEVLRISSEKFDLLEAVEVNDVSAVSNFIRLGQEACGYPTNASAISLAAKRLRIDRKGRGGMTAVHLAAFHGYTEALQILLEAGADANAVCEDGETPLHTACTGGSVRCAGLLLEHGANPLATDAKGLVPCEKHVAGGRQDMKHLLESKAFQATPANLMALRMDLSEVALQIDAEEDLFVRMGVAIKYLRKGLRKKEADASRLRSVVDSRDVEMRNLRERMDSVQRLLSGIVVK